MARWRLLAVLFLVLCVKLTHAQNFLWAKQIGGSGYDYSNSIAVDASGNIYTTGEFEDTVDFDPGIGTYNLISVQRNIFISKLDSSGNFIWAKHMAGGWGGGASITLDAGGNVLTTGFFTGTVDFNPASGIYNLSSNGQLDVFISKLDSSGLFIWTKQFGGVEWDICRSIAVDTSNNVYTSVEFKDTVDFDPGIGTYNLISAGYQDVCISKLDSSGNFIWAKQIGGPSGEYSKSVGVDIFGNVYTIGYFSGTVDFDPEVGTYNLTTAGGDGFISKLDASGNFLWAKQFSGLQITSIALDAFQNVYTTGIFVNTSDFDPGPGTYNLTSAGQDDIFISKLDSSGNFIWAKGMGANYSDIAYSIALDAAGNVYTTGTFHDTVDFDPGNGIFNLIAGWKDMFISKLDSSGNFLRADRIGGNADAWYSDITIDASGSACMTGYFQGTTDFDPSFFGTYNMTCEGIWDIFILKLADATSSMAEAPKESNNGIIVFPNPTNSKIIIISTETSEVEDFITIYDTVGKIVLQKLCKDRHQEIDVLSFAKGVYIVSLQTEKEKLVKKF